MKKNKFSYLTVFIICSNKNNYYRKKKKLLDEYKKIKIKPIISVSPMSKAFNEMHLRCKTKYFIQLDEDMHLNRGAINKLYDEIHDSNFRTICVTGQLYEQDFGLGGSVKIWKKNIFNYFKFGDHRTVDRKFFKKIFFFKKKSFTKILGYHKPRFNDFSRFSKVLGDICKWRYLNSNKMFVHNALSRVLKERNFFEVIALLIALNLDYNFIKKSKDFKKDYEIFELIKKYKKNYKINFFKKKINNIIFFNYFMNTYNGENKVHKFNLYFQKNLIKRNKLIDLNLINKKLND